jgi:hypothetical protein
MSSVLSGFSKITQETKFHHIKTVGYYDSSVNATIPVPFIVQNETIDIHIEDNVEADLIENETAGSEYITSLCKSMGGLTLATKLGPNFIRWLNNWVADYYNSSVIDTFTVHVPATMTRIQMTNEQNEDYDVLKNDTYDEPWGVSLNAPSSDNFVNGNEGNKWLSRWVFKTPLTVKFMLDGSPRYLTYYTVFAPTTD